MRVMQVLADATNTIAEGEVLQLMNCHDPDVDEQRYLEVIRRKTAKLFEAAARLGGVLASVPPELEEGLASYGTHVGTAFQLVDDVLDYSGDAATIGKSLGDDLAEGKPTLPLIHAMRTGTAQQSALVRSAIVDGWRERLPGGLDAMRASASRAGLRSTPTIMLAPTSLAPWITLRPMPPSPNTTTLAPGSTRAVLMTAPRPVVTPQPI